MAKKVSLTTAEKLDRSRDGRSQKWIVLKLAEKGFPMTEVQFSVKKNNDSFTEEELEALGSVLPDFADYQ